MKNTKETLRTPIISAVFIMILVATSLILMKLTDNLTNSSADNIVKNIEKNVEQYISVDNVKYRIVDSFEKDKSSVAEKYNEQVSMSAAEAGWFQSVANVKYRILNSFEQEKSSAAEKDNERVFMSAAEAWSKAVADGSFGLKIIDSVGKVILNGYESFKNASEDFYRKSVAEDGNEIFKLIDMIIRHSTTSYYVTSKIFDTTTTQITNSPNDSERIISYKESELSKERTDLRNFEYKILGATKSENREHILDLEHYIFLRVLDLGEQINDKMIMLEEYSKDRNEKLDIFFNPSRYSSEKQQSLQIQKPNSYYEMLIKDIDKKNEIIKDMQENIFKAIQIIQNLEDRISMQEKCEELE